MGGRSHCAFAHHDQSRPCRFRPSSRGPLRVNRVDRATSVACRLHPRLRTYRCGAAKCRNGPKADIEGELVICRDKDLRDD